MNKPLCETCAFFERMEHSLYQGRCRRYAPRPKTEEHEATWPTVDKADWCGEYVNQNDPDLEYIWGGKQ